MKISELGGETALISIIRNKYGINASDCLLLGIGDDAALIAAGDLLTIVTTDMLIENTHFRMDINDPYSIGWKSIAVNISDIAAMGGLPAYSFISIGLPDIDVSIVEDIYRGMQDSAAKFDSGIAGGDTVASGCGIVISVTQLGKVEPAFAARRDGAREGDSIIVTNTLGDSRAGLELLLKYGLEKSKRISPYLVYRHLRPEPRVCEARAAVQTGKVHSMMDLSDGLSSDLQKLCEASGVGARVYASSLPISEELRKIAQSQNADPIKIAASGGEDYELLITCAPEDAENIITKIQESGSSATIIGEAVKGHDVKLISSSGEEESMPESWSHF